MADRRETIIEHPNRDKASSKSTRVVVVVLLLVSIVLLAIATVGGWEKLEGMKTVQVAYLLIYLLMAFFVARWNRGVLPVIAALAIILAIFAAVATPEWFDRDKSGFDQPALDAGVLGTICAVIIPVQVLLIVFAMQGFAQGWNVEVERYVDEPRQRGGVPATA
jgi:presenilin-like A22 family membrane protease